MAILPELHLCHTKFVVGTGENRNNRFQGFKFMRKTATASRQNRDIMPQIRIHALDRREFLRTYPWSLVLDVALREDDSKAKKDNSPLNLNVHRKTSANLLKTVDVGYRLRIRKKMLKASRDTNFLDSVLFKK